ncbi:MAG: cytochrome b/b6 domain-containing protein [Steroidobacteraceae bacterium]
MQVRVWDAPTRLAHWGIAICFGVSWWTVETYRMEWHRWSGYVMLGLLLFRVYWGVFGSTTARFASFIRGPREIWAHVTHLGTRSATDSMGHNALGALSVVAMLLMLVAQVTLGLFTVDVDGIESGPLSHLVDFDTGRLLAKYHGIGFTVLQWLIGLHIVALLFYTFYKRDRLIPAMITGNKPWQPGWDEASAALRFAPFWVFFVGAILAAGAAWYITAS